MRLEAAPSFAQLTTLRLGGRALALARPKTMAELEELPRVLEREGGQPFMLGRGSNLLASDGELPLVLVRWEGEHTLHVCERPSDSDSGVVRITAGANVPLPRLTAFAAVHGCGAVAGLAGIPGEVGGAMTMNAGSWGVEFAALTRRCTVFTPNHGVLELHRGIGYTPAYRHTVFHMTEADTPWMLILNVELELFPVDGLTTKSAVLTKISENIRRKAAVQPVRARSAGCVFKNPAPAVSDQSAGKLLDAAGFRGKPLGGVGFSDLHANFLVNHGSGTATEALQLMDEARTAVAQRFGVQLETEVRVLSC